MVLTDHHEAIEFDLLGKHVDVLDFWAGRVSVRRMSVIVGQLLADPRSAVSRSVSPDPIWTQGDYILADLYDLTHAGLTGGKSDKSYPRPGDDRRAAELEANRRAAHEAQRQRIIQRERARLAERSDGG